MWISLRLSALLSAILLAPMGASAAASDGPTADELRRALVMPQLVSCDELVCEHRVRGDFEIRSLRCASQDKQTAICSYERTPVRVPTFKLVGKDIHEVGSPAEWTAAETRLQRFQTWWRVIADSGDR